MAVEPQALASRDHPRLRSDGQRFARPRGGGPSLPLRSPGSVRVAQPPFLADGLELEERVRFRRTVYLPDPPLASPSCPSLDVLNLFDFPDPNAVTVCA